ncbi:hypothetical protein [Schumannella luteola]
MPTTIRPSATDRAALAVTILLGAVVSVVTVVQAVLRIVQIVPNREVPITVSFADTPATLPVGPGGADVGVVPQSVVLSVSDMAPITVASLVLAEVVYMVAVVGIVLGVSLVIRNIIRGDAFSRNSVGIVGGISLAVGIGVVLTWLFRTMGANGAAAALADGYPENTPIGIDLPILFVIASLGALAAAWQAGYRLQRDTEGLV